MNQSTGPLARDFRNPNVCLEVFRRIKHTRLEGLIVEYEVDQVLLPAFLNAGWTIADALVLYRWSGGASNQFLVLEEQETPAVQKLKEALRRAGTPVCEMTIRDHQLMMRHDVRGRLLPSLRPAAAELAADFVSGHARGSSTATSGDADRIRSAFWGFASLLGGRVSRWAEELVIKDDCIGPLSRALWDLDRFLVSPEGAVVYLETKHKYPIRGRMVFGMNLGEVNLTKRLVGCGISAWHVILVKPRWDERLSSMYLFFDREAREHALWIAGDMARPPFFSDSARSSAAAKTSIYGQERVSYSTLELANFRVLGPNAERAALLSQRLLGLVTGEFADQLPALTVDALNSARLQ